jgi:hypothetical protein
MFTKIVIIIAIISILMSILSLRKQHGKAEIKKVRKNLSKGRVVFQSKG